MSGPRERTVKIEIPADPRYAYVARIASGSSASAWADAEDARDLAAAVGEALALSGMSDGASGTCTVELELVPGGVEVVVTGPGPVTDGDETDMARLMLTGLVDDFTVTAGTGSVSVTLSKAVIIAVVAFLFFGPDKLPEVARAGGKFMRQFKQIQDEVTSTIRSEMYEVPDFTNLPKLDGSDAKPAEGAAAAATATAPSSVGSGWESEDEEESEE